MFMLNKLNVVKIVDTAAKRDELISQGFVLMQTPDDKTKAVVDEKYNAMPWHDLRKYAMSKGVDVAERKKADIIKDLLKLEG